MKPPIRRLHQKIIRIIHCVRRHLFDIALGDEQVIQTIVVYGAKLRMPAG